MNVNDNTLDISKYRGPVSPCPLCSTLSDAAKLDAMSSGRVCNLCLGRKFIAHCLNCHGTGQFAGTTVWDGGRSPHTSTCTPCGGTGVFAVAQPADWDQAKWDADAAWRNAILCTCTHVFGSHNGQHRDPANLDQWIAGKCTSKIGAAMCPCQEFAVANAAAVTEVVENQAVTV